MSTERALTPRDKTVIQAIRYLSATSGRPPTQREIAVYLGVSPTRVVQLLERLDQRGYLSRLPKSPRSIVLTGKAAA